MDIFVTSLIVMDILIISTLLLIFGMVSIRFSLFKSIIMDTSNITIANWDENNLQAVTNRFAIIFATNMLILSAIALILHIRQQGEQMSIGFHFKQYIWYDICYSNNGYIDILIPIQAINYGFNGCDTAPIGNEITITTTTESMDRIGEYHDIILDPIVLQVLIAFVYLSNWFIIPLFNVIRNKMDITYDILVLNCWKNLLLNCLSMFILLSCLLVSNRNISNRFSNGENIETSLSMVTPIVIEFICVIMVVYKVQIIWNKYSIGYLFVVAFFVVNWIQQGWFSIKPECGYVKCWKIVGKLSRYYCGIQVNDIYISIAIGHMEMIRTVTFI